MLDLRQIPRQGGMGGLRGQPCGFALTLGGHQRLVSPGLHIQRAALVVQRCQRRLGVGHRALAAAGAVKAISLGAQHFQLAAQIGQPGAGRKQHLTQIALAGQNAVAALFQRVIVQTEHRRVTVARQTAQTTLHQRLGQRRAVAVQQRARRPFHPNHRDLGAIHPQHRADPQGRVGVQKIVGALPGDAEQQIKPGRQSGRFARLIRPIDQMQVRRPGGGRRKGQALVGEMAIARQVQPVQTHQAASPWPET